MDIQSSFHMNETNENGNDEYILNGLIESQSSLQSSILESAETVNITEGNNHIDDKIDEDVKDDILASHIVYNLKDEQNQEQLDYDYHHNKDHGNWQYAKMIVSHSWEDKTNTEFFTDYLELQFQTNNDCFENIRTVYYKNDLDIDIIYSFEAEPGKHLIDNLRIPPFKPHGIIFNNPENANKWSFKIVVITTRGIYSANRFINDTIIGYY